MEATYGLMLKCSGKPNLQAKRVQHNPLVS